MQDGKTALGVPPNVAAALAYVLGWVSGLVVLLVEKEDRSVRYHAAQSILVFGVLHLFFVLAGFVVSILFAIPFLGPLLAAVIALILAIIGPVTLVAWIVLIVFAFTGRDYRAPVVSTYAERLAAMSM